MHPKVKLYYLFDPLCGWCYGASATITALGRHPDVDLRTLATGLYSGRGARPMKGHAAQIWAYDQKIAALTGQKFSEAYRRDVLGAADARLDSTTATLATVAVADTAPDRVVEVLSAIQSARYIRGEDVTSSAVVAVLLAEMGLAEACARVLHPDDDLLKLARQQTAKAQGLLAELQLQGVPALFTQIDDQRRVLSASTLYAGIDAILPVLKLPPENRAGAIARKA